ncbi:hypothetical protein [Pararhizobium gei]|uniref:hypothetical protein n=1 Tax=Pararhizobium gei TaxID=1395951 RepID=UPI0023DB3777|nr:hypothetical protein [Rhizobium gei]
MTAFRSRTADAVQGMDLLPPDRQGRRPERTVRRTAEIIDVEFETVSGQSRRSSHPVFNDNKRNATAPLEAPGGGLSGKVLHGLEHLLQTASPKAFAILVTCLCAPVFLLFAGLFEYRSPITPVPALSINNVTTTLDDANGMKVVSVYGAVENRSDTPEIIPVIQVDIVAAGHSRTASRIFAGHSILSPGETRPFSARLPHTGGKLPEVKVSFTH